MSIEHATRRSFLYGLGASLGAVAFTDLLAKEQASLPDSPSESSTTQVGHHVAKAKACIFLYMAGGPSHIDTFDPKPKLDELHMQKFVRKDKFASAMASGERYFVKSPFKFQRAGQSGLEMCEHWKHLADVADDL